LSKNTLYAYLDHLQESFVLFLAPIHDRSIRRQAVNPKKLFVIDPALAYAFAPAPMLDRGHKLENLVFLHWRRQREDLFYLERPHEVDLVVGESPPEILVNVAYSLQAPEVLQREMSGLKEAQVKRPGIKAELVAVETAQAASTGNICVVPAWKYLLRSY
jgi:hypothetical protein